MTGRRRTSQQGFTLIELLLAMAILGIILATVGLSVTQGFRTTTETRARVDRSNLADFSAKLFGSDVASATAAPTTYSPPAATTCGTGTVADIPAAHGTSVQYAVVTDAGKTALVRRTCAADGSMLGSRTIGQTSTVFGASAECAPTETCRRLALTVTWTGSEPTTFTLRAERRAQ